MERICRPIIERNQRLGLDTQKIACGFPFSRSPCRGKLPKRAWKHLIPHELRSGCRQHGSQASQGTTDVQCTHCKTYSAVHLSTFITSKRWSCPSCDRDSCLFCDKEQCKQCTDCSFSRLFSTVSPSGRLVPMRKCFVTHAQRLTRLETIQSLGDGSPNIECPTCSVALHKTSACNELHHCGGFKVCNACGARTCPWEDSFPPEHWESCPRWDFEIPGYLCTSDCGDASDCRVHSFGVRKTAEHRLRLCLSLVEKEKECLEESPLKLS